MAQPSGLYYPNRIARHFLLAMEDVMGQGGLSMVLGLAHLEQYNHIPPDNLNREFDLASMAALTLALEEMYGPRGGRGIGMRIGRACFSQGMKTFGVLAGVRDPAFRALPLVERVRMGLIGLASVFTSFSDQPCVVTEETDTFRFSVTNSAMAWGRTSDKPVCHALAGIIQECLRWATNGKEFYVLETACHACGAEQCVFSINKTPIGGQ